MTSAFTPIRKLQVWRRLANGKQVLVGTLAQNSQAVFFQYDADYLQNYHSLSPFLLPFTGELQQAPKAPHHGLQGVFADSLPDGWGLLLMDRLFRRHGILPHQLTAIDRLSYIGDRGMGALSYVPLSDYAPTAEDDWIDLARLGKEAQQLFDGQTDSVLAHLAHAGSSGGSRPKAQIYIDPDQPERASTMPQSGLEPWLVKFTSSTLTLGHEEGLCEAAYLTLAGQAGIKVPQWQLITPPADSPAITWLVLRRFDCSTKNPATGRYHMHSSCGVLDADFRQPSLDYEDLIKASQVLCQSPAVGQQQFVRALFNLFALNQDDQSKNWAFIMDDQGNWQPSPFYDVTFSPNPHGEHATAFCGYGKAPPLQAIQQLARQANFSSWKKASETIARIVEAIQSWDDIARELGVQADTRRLIGKQLNTVWQQNKALSAEG